MPRRALADELVEVLIQEIVAGVYAPGAALPSEVEMASTHGVSRLTVREAVKGLASRNVLRVQHGIGTFVRPVSEWSAMDPVLLSATSAIAGGDVSVSRKLLELRSIVEPSCAELAATRRTEDDIRNLQGAVSRMREAADVDDLTLFVSADMEFHQGVADASGNIFLAALFQPIAALMVEARRQTSEYRIIRDHAITHHQSVVDAIQAGSAKRAGGAMRAHLKQTSADLEQFVMASGRKTNAKTVRSI